MSRAQPGVQNCGKNSHILIVDDNEMNRNLMQLQFCRSGFDVSVAERGEIALEMLSKQVYDLILLDIMMPGINGLEVLSQIRMQFTPLDLPVIMVTADDLEESVINALNLGANDYLVKPLNIAVALARVRTQLQLSKLDKLKAEFVRFASHDLKKPTLVILDIVETLKNECITGTTVTDDIPEMIKLIGRTGENMQRVIDGFIKQDQLSNSSAHSVQSHVRLNEIVNNSLKDNADYARRKGVTLKHELQSNLPEIEADEFRISQVVDNLIGNAMKFSPRETTTVVRTRADDQYVYAEICDGGPGLTQSDLQRVFQRYAKLSNKPTGNETSSGIGLNMSKQFIDFHNGTIGARNNDTQGATFWFQLPIKHHTQN